MVYGHERDVEYFEREEKRKGKKKKKAKEEPPTKPYVQATPSRKRKGRIEKIEIRTKRKRLKKKMTTPSNPEIIPKGVEF